MWFLGDFDVLEEVSWFLRLLQKNHPFYRSRLFSAFPFPLQLRCANRFSIGEVYHLTIRREVPFLDNSGKPELSGGGWKPSTSTPSVFYWIWQISSSLKPYSSCCIVTPIWSENQAKKWANRMWQLPKGSGTRRESRKPLCISSIITLISSTLIFLHLRNAG